MEDDAKETNSITLDEERILQILDKELSSILPDIEKMIRKILQEQGCLIPKEGRRLVQSPLFWTLVERWVNNI